MQHCSCFLLKRIVINGPINLLFIPVLSYQFIHVYFLCLLLNNKLEFESSRVKLSWVESNRIEWIIIINMNKKKMKMKKSKKNKIKVGVTNSVRMQKIILFILKTCYICFYDVVAFAALGLTQNADILVIFFLYSIYIDVTVSPVLPLLLHSFYFFFLAALRRHFFVFFYLFFIIFNHITHSPFILCAESWNHFIWQFISDFRSSVHFICCCFLFCHFALCNETKFKQKQKKTHKQISKKHKKFHENFIKWKKKFNLSIICASWSIKNNNTTIFVFFLFWVKYYSPVPAKLVLKLKLQAGWGSDNFSSVTVLCVKRRWK